MCETQPPGSVKVTMYPDHEGNLHLSWEAANAFKAHKGLQRLIEEYRFSAMDADDLYDMVLRIFASVTPQEIAVINSCRKIPAPVILKGGYSAS